MDAYDFYQNFRIGSVQRNADKAEAKSVGNSSDIRVLQDQVDQLSLVCQAMCELLENVGFNKKMLMDKVQEIDLRDGKLDGKLSKSESCFGCNRKLNARHVKCMYCGTLK